MKITQSHQDKLESLMAENAERRGLNINQFVKTFREEVKAGRIKIQKCEATNCFSRLLMGKALTFVCDEVYKYADDSHLETFYKKLYKKYS